MVVFRADINYAACFVLKDVNDFALDGGALEFIARKGGIDLLLLFCLWGVRLETCRTEQGPRALHFHAGTASEKNARSSSQNENQA